MTTKYLASVLALMGAQAHACGELTVSDAWARLAPPAAPVMAAYASLGNSSEQSVLLQSASSKDFERVELHSMSMENGVMQMRKLDLIEVKVDQTVKLAPGGLHLMLIGPKRSFVAGDKIDITLRLCEEKEQVVSFPVREQQVSGDEHAGHAH